MLLNSPGKSAFHVWPTSDKSKATCQGVAANILEIGFKKGRNDIAEVRKANLAAKHLAALCTIGRWCLFNTVHSNDGGVHQCHPRRAYERVCKSSKHNGWLIYSIVSVLERTAVKCMPAYLLHLVHSRGGITGAMACSAVGKARSKNLQNTVKGRPPYA